MYLNITAAEQEMLLDILRDRLGTMREQVRHAATSHYRDELKERHALISELIEKLETATTAAP